jgi:integrase
MTLTEAFENLYRPRNLRSASGETIRLWHIALRMYSRFLRRDATIDDLTDDSLARFATWRLSSVSPATVNRDLASLLALWRWLAKRGKINRWPDVPLEQEPLRSPIAWTQEEFCRIISVVRSTDGMIGIVPAKKWWLALLLTCFDSAERIGAVLALHWPDVDIDGRWIIFKAESRKGRDQDSVIRIAPDTATAISALPRTGRIVFQWPLTRQYLWRRYGDLLESAGLPNDRKRKFHCVRKTVASHAEAAGGNATELLRHASRKNTRAYLDPRILRPQQAIDLLWRPT